MFARKLSKLLLLNCKIYAKGLFNPLDILNKTESIKMINEAFSFLYLLAAVLGLTASVFLILRQGNKDASSLSKIPAGIASEKILVVILLVLTLQSLKTFFFSIALFTTEINSSGVKGLGR